MDDFRIPGPVDRPHARKQVDGLLGGVIKKFRNDLDAAQRPRDGDEDHNAEARAPNALACRESVPLWRGCLRGCLGVRHWNSLRIHPDRISPTRMIAITLRTIVSTKS